jgi:CRISPR/Cas system CMR subunit Cmr6 (Cas7 group RAMP superfamily)
MDNEKTEKKTATNDEAGQTLLNTEDSKDENLEAKLAEREEAIATKETTLTEWEKSILTKEAELVKREKKIRDKELEKALEKNADFLRTKQHAPIVSGVGNPFVCERDCILDGVRYKRGERVFTEICPPHFAPAPVEGKAPRKK